MNDLISRSALIRRIEAKGFRPSSAIAVPAVIAAIKAAPPVEFDELERIVKEEKETLEKWKENGENTTREKEIHSGPLQKR